MDGDIHYLALPPGTVLNEFKILSVLGHGGFGITYRAWDQNLDETVAIKEFMPNEFATRIADRSVRPKSSTEGPLFSAGLTAFMDEARRIARFKHPNIMKVRRFFELHGTGYIVLEFEEGPTLGKLLERVVPGEDDLRRMTLALLDGLSVVHNKAMLHRDVKPSNIIIREEDGSPVLIDFGAARDFAERNSRSVTAIATPGYSPPEQYGAGGSQGPWTDLYALGGVLYRCVTGTTPVDSLRRLRRDVLVPARQAAAGRYDDVLLHTIDWMMAIDEEARPQSAAEVRKALERGLDPPPPDPPPARSVSIHEDAGLGFLLRCPEKRRQDVLETAFFATPPGQYLHQVRVPASRIEPAWGDSVVTFPLDRVEDSGNPEGTTYRIPDAVSRSVHSTKVRIEPKGLEPIEHVWPGQTQDGENGPRRAIWLWIVAALLLLLAIGGSLAVLRPSWLSDQFEGAQRRAEDTGPAIESVSSPQVARRAPADPEPSARPERRAPRGEVGGEQRRAEDTGPAIESGSSPQVARHAPADPEPPARPERRAPRGEVAPSAQQIAQDARTLCDRTAGLRFDNDRPADASFVEDTGVLNATTVDDGVTACVHARRTNSGRRFNTQLGRLYAERAVRRVKAGAINEGRQDMASAVAAWTAASNQGSSYAANLLGTYYNGTYNRASGFDFVQPDVGVSVDFWRRAAEQNNVVGKRNYAAQLLSGNGVTQDVQRALQLLVEAARDGDDRSAAIMGVALFTGYPARDLKDQAKGWQLLKRAPCDYSDGQRVIRNEIAKGRRTSEGMPSCP